MTDKLLLEIENFILTLKCDLVEKYLIYNKLLDLYFQGKTDQIKETIKIKK